MILSSLFLALGQLGDPALRKVLGRGILLAALGLGVASWALVHLAGWVLPDSVSLPWIGTVGWLDEALGWALVPVAALLSVFLIVPVASAISAMFLDEVAEAVERRHYPRLPPVRPMPWGEAIRDGAGFFLVSLLATGVAFALSLAAPPLAPIILVAVNGWLIGREFSHMAAARRMGAEEARAFSRAHGGTFWLAGAILALPLLIPVVNLAVPVLAAATFTHLVRRMA